jgi:DNA-directed RNA polymerase subunit M/transcription elongation factor TFIIS
MDQILEGNVDPAHISSLENYDLCPDASQAERDEIDIRKKIKVDIKISKAYKCGKCGNDETTIRKFQGRAADEDNTLSIKCMSCGHTWRKN